MEEYIKTHKDIIHTNEALEEEDIYSLIKKGNNLEHESIFEEPAINHSIAMERGNLHLRKMAIVITGHDARRPSAQPQEKSEVHTTDILTAENRLSIMAPLKSTVSEFLKGTINKDDLAQIEEKDEENSSGGSPTGSLRSTPVNKENKMNKREITPSLFGRPTKTEEDSDDNSFKETSEELTDDEGKKWRNKRKLRTNSDATIFKNINTYNNTTKRLRTQLSLRAIKTKKYIYVNYIY